MEIERFERKDLEETGNGGVEQEDVNKIGPWTKQITIRGLTARSYWDYLQCDSLTTGLVPNLNVSAALLAFLFVRTWTKLPRKAGIVSSPFTGQENTIIQACAVACYSIAVGG